MKKISGINRKVIEFVQRNNLTNLCVSKSDAASICGLSGNGGKGIHAGIRNGLDIY